MRGATPEKKLMCGINKLVVLAIANYESRKESGDRNGMELLHVLTAGVKCESEVA
jgi:hypothetical protein